MLTRREWEIVALLAKGMAIKRVARWLGLSHRTVDTHLDNLSRKVGTRRPLELAQLAVSHGLLSAGYVLGEETPTHAFRTLSEPALARNSSGHRVKVAKGVELKLVEATHAKDGMLKWRFVDRIGHVYSFRDHSPAFATGK